MAEISHERGQQAAGYHVGDYDRRPWGFWLVTDVPATEDVGYCEKIIVITPGKILSLQSHKLRHETWTVLDGTLIAIVNGECFTLEKRKKVDIPAGSPHCMANLGDVPCIIKERQTGVCRENDIIRYLDAYGRITTGTKERVMTSVNLYLDLLKQLQGQEKKYA